MTKSRDTVDPQEQVLEGRGAVVTDTLNGIAQSNPRQFVNDVIRALGKPLTEHQAEELANLLEDASFWCEHDQKGDNAKDYFFCLSAGNLSKAQDEGDETDIEHAWALYSRFNPHTGTKKGPDA